MVHTRSPVALVLMGVAGSGKTTVGRALADALGCEFFDGDDFHPAANVAKMASGIPLTDEDRLPWLESLSGVIRQQLAKGSSCVVACSALKSVYRNVLAGDHVQFVFLRASKDLVARRFAMRRDHFMPARLIDSQFEALEEPTDAVIVDSERPVEEIVMLIGRHLGQ